MYCKPAFRVPKITLRRAKATCRYTVYNRSLLSWLLFQASNSKAVVAIIDAFALAERCGRVRVTVAENGAGCRRERDP